MNTRPAIDALLIVVDVQRGFINSHSAHVVEPIIEFLDQWSESGRRAILTRFHNPIGSKWETLKGWKHLRDQGETDLVPELEHLALKYFDSGLITIEDKYSFTSITPSIRHILENRKIEEVYLCGLDTDACVLATAIDLFEMVGVRPIILTDLCASSGSSVDPTNHEMGIRLARRLIGREQLLESGSLFD